MDARVTAFFRRTWRRQAISTLVMAAILFGAADTLRYWQGWLFLAAFIGASAALGLYFAKHDPALLERRMRAGPRAEQEPAQRIIITLLMADFFLLIVVPALLYRWEGSPLPAWLSILGAAGIVASFVVFFYVMKQNSYAASTVRVEAEQPVISSGLYGVVRHPMYTGALLLAACTPLTLGSALGLLLVIPMLPILAWRLLDEERVLKRDLPGYTDYCRRVRARLIPGLW